jgi:hypothetical protein
MWQRIQTVFLVIAVISLIISIFFPIWAFTQGQTKHVLYALYYGTTEGAGTASLTSLYVPYCMTGVLFIASITLSAIEITKYKDRLLQIKLGALNSLFLAGGLISSVYFATDMIKTHEGGQYGFGLWLPGLAVVCNWLAMRFIKRDEKLVRDSNRLR